MNAAQYYGAVHGMVLFAIGVGIYFAVRDAVRDGRNGRDQ
jgi:hypothetical protein